METKVERIAKKQEIIDKLIALLEPYLGEICEDYGVRLGIRLSDLNIDIFAVKDDKSLFGSTIEVYKRDAWGDTHPIEINYGTTGSYDPGSKNIAPQFLARSVTEFIVNWDVIEDIFREIWNEYIEAFPRV